ncbi:MarR family winged helix-turn-helix transcriptional regulator [Nocardia goodfellowii]|uniref:DNA-binding MarR family transcriptional regulator n=1 Tax=Nocardia goodfellowii TaxID=882446 RepID=A0ABS4Q7X5_9NOCA|nr:MarR family winged helix-turn-helix transcriptional regulator [Nocardia goodfellowii]MBP2187693.1 DNA-binding MarR family transcriptional regulator [Nocardia goodfellowii]
MSIDPSATLLKLLVQTTRAFEQELNSRLRAESHGDLRPAHYAVFRYLDPAGSRVTTLAEAAGMTQQSMGELITHLERCGYVERRVDPADRRGRLVVLTESGHAVLRVAAGHIRSIEEQLRRALGAEGLVDLRELLARSGESLTAIGDSVRTP